MITLDIDSGKYELDDGLRNRIIERIGGLDEFMNTLDKGHVVIAWEGGSNNETRVSVEVWGPGHHFDASDTNKMPVTAIDNARKKLESQIARVHSKELDKREHRDHE